MLYENNDSGFVVWAEEFKPPHSIPEGLIPIPGETDKMLLKHSYGTTVIRSGEYVLEFEKNDPRIISRKVLEWNYNPLVFEVNLNKSIK